MEPADGDRAPLQDTVDLQVSNVSDSRIWMSIRAIALHRWCILMLVVIGWGPLFVTDVVVRAFDTRKAWSWPIAFGMAWGLVIALPFTILAVVIGLIRLFKISK